jgi:hypothetical protein
MGSCSGGVEARRTRFNEGCARHTQGQHKYIHYDDILLCEIGCCHGGICWHVVIRALGVFGGPMALGDVRVRSLATDHKGCRAVLVHMDRGTLASAARAFGDEDLFVAFHRIHDGLNVVQWDGLAWRCLPVDRCRAKLPGLASGVGVLRKELAPHVVKQAGHSVNADRFAFASLFTVTRSRLLRFAVRSMAKPLSPSLLYSLLPRACGCQEQTVMGLGG